MGDPCPSRDDLAAFAADDLSFEANSRLAAHLETCDLCLKTLDALSNVPELRPPTNTWREFPDPSPELLSELARQIASEAAAREASENFSPRRPAMHQSSTDLTVEADWATGVDVWETPSADLPDGDSLHLDAEADSFRVSQ